MLALNLGSSCLTLLMLALHVVCHNSLPWNKILKCWKCILFFFILCGGHTLQHVCGGQRTPVGAGSLLLNESWGTNSSCQYWWQLPLPPWSISLGLFIIVMWHTYMMCVSVCVFWSQLFLTTMDYRDWTHVVRHVMQVLLAAEPPQGWWS